MDIESRQKMTKFKLFQDNLEFENYLYSKLHVSGEANTLYNRKRAVL